MRFNELRLGSRSVARADVFCLCVVSYFLAALVLGGGTREGFLGDVILQFAAIPLFIFAFYKLTSRDVTEAVLPSADASYRALRSKLVFCSLLVIVPVLQLLPLPPQRWNALPGRDVIAQTFHLLNEPLPWWPISMAPESTWLSLLSLLPPLAVFLGVLSFSYRERRVACFALIAFGAVSVILGLLQLAQGPQSSLRFFQFTNPSEAVGFFANRNHYAALLYVATVFTACWATDVVLHAGIISRRDLTQSSALMRVAASLIIFSMLVMAQTMARSRAGIILSMIALIGAVFLALMQTSDESKGSRAAGTRTAKIMIATAGFAILFSMQYALYRILDRFTADPLEDARVLFAKKTFALAKAYFPVGTGVGTFVPVYALSEKPNEIAGFFANRAHNDILEASLESGIFGITLMLIFALWLMIRTWSAWRPISTKTGDFSTHQSSFDRSIMRAASLSLILLALHSFVDYPLRTSALMVVAALCCALLIAPYKPDLDPEPQKHSSSSSFRWRKRRPRSEMTDHDTPIVPTRPRQAWSSDKELPESWRKSASPEEKSK